MWYKLSDPCHAAECDPGGSRLQPLGQVLRKLATKPYADQLYGHWSHDRFFIGTCPSYEEHKNPAYHNILAIEPAGKRIRIGYGETPSSKWGLGYIDGKLKDVGCWEKLSEDEVVSRVDQIVNRDLAWQSQSEKG